MVIKKIKNTIKTPKFKLLTAIVLSVLLIGYTSYVSYNSIINLKNTINSIAEPNNLILSLQDIQKDLTAVQSYIRTYTYSHEYQYLNKYKTAEKSLDTNLAKLGNIITDDYKSQYDSITIYINYKKNIIAYYVSLQTEDKNAQLDSITSRIDGIMNETDSARRAQNMQANEKGFRKIINFIFSNKDKATEGTVILQNDSIMALKRSVQDAKNIAEEQQELQEKLEMELLDQDLMIMNEVSEFISDIFHDEDEKITATKEKSVENIQSTLLFLGAIIGLTLLFISYLLIKIIFDIKRGERYRDKLEDAKRKAEDLTETKARFMSNMSHEIRTPLTAIVGFSEQAKKQNITFEEKTKYLNIISQSSEYLLNIVNEILTFSKIEAGKDQLDEHDFSLKEVLEEVYLFLKPKADDKNIQLLLHTDKKLHDWYKCDSQKIKQILINLTSNAVKFTNEGSVKIISTLKEQKDGLDTIELRVEDTGIGISNENIDKIFGEFTQNDETTSRKYGGTGLGLAISMKYAQLLGWDLRVESELNEGSTFIITLILKHSDKIPLQNKIKESEKPDLENQKVLKVLYADDDEWNRMLGGVVLENMNIIPDMAVNGLEAVKKAKEKKYDIILMDIQMPELDGKAATREIRKFKSDHRPIIIALTANVIKKDIDSFLEAGMDDYLTKPFKEEELFEKINRHIPQ